MNFIRDSLTQYRELYAPMRRSFHGWSRGPLRSLIAILCLLALLSLMFTAGWYLAGGSRDLAEILQKIGLLCRAAILPVTLIGWVVLALANLRVADSLLDEALLGRRGSAGMFRFLLALHSGILPLLTGFILTIVVLGSQVAHSIHSTEPVWLKSYENWASNMALLQRELWMEITSLPADYLLFASFTAVALAMACMSRQASTVWLVFNLLNLQLLLDIYASFGNVYTYSIYWQDSMFNTQWHLLGLAILALLLVPGLPLLNLKDSDRPLLAGYAALALLRGSDMFFSLSRYGNVAMVQYDQYVMPLANLSWFGNITFRTPLFSCLPVNYNAIYGMGSRAVTDYNLMLLDQVRSSLITGSWGIPLAILGNLLWLAAVVCICLYSVRRHEQAHLQ